MSEFNLIDEKWICVRKENCEIEEISLRELFANAHNYIELGGETKAQDFAVMRFILALIHTVFSRYDRDGNEVDITEDAEYLTDNWADIFEDGCFPTEPFERYFSEWYDRFWLFDEKYPFYQSNAVNGKTKEPCEAAKMIGTMFQSGNKIRLFKNRDKDGLTLTYPEAARWLLNINCFDDIAAKNPTPKRPWVGRLGLIAVKGKSLFETLMLNYYATFDYHNTVYESHPSWEDDNSNPVFNAIIPVPNNQAALLSLISRRIYLCRENGFVNKYYLGGGNYFEEEEVFSEQMTLWYVEKDKNGKIIKVKPKMHNSATRAWQEFGMIAALSENVASGKDRKPGVINWIKELRDKKYLPKDYTINVSTAAVIYNFKQATCLPIDDVISDSLSFHADLLDEVGSKWRNRINVEIGKCEEAARLVYKLSVNLQCAAGAKEPKDEKDKSVTGDKEKAQFYGLIDQPFRLWLAELDADKHLDEYSYQLEDEIRQIALRYGEELAESYNETTIFGGYGKDKSLITALQIFSGKIAKLYRKEAKGNE